MKKLFLFLFIPFILSAQSWIPQGNGYTYTVTIKYGGAATSDSIENVDFDMQYGELASMWVIGNSNDPVDSFYVKTGGKSILVSGVTPDDTAWGGYATLKDSAGNIQSGLAIVNNTTGKRFWFFEPVLDVLEFGLLNHRGTLATRSITFVLKTKKTIIE